MAKTATRSNNLKVSMSSQFTGRVDDIFSDGKGQELRTVNVSSQFLSPHCVLEEKDFIFHKLSTFSLKIKSTTQNNLLKWEFQHSSDGCRENTQVLSSSALKRRWESDLFICGHQNARFSINKFVW